jgi:hypothetical protein
MGGVRWHDRRLAVGFNMSWIFVDAIELEELCAALDVKSTGEAADPYDLIFRNPFLGTTHLFSI